MRKFRFILIYVLLFCSFTFFACEDATTLNCASISEITQAGSENYGVKVNFYNDSRLKGKGVDVQVKFSKLGDITIWEENHDRGIYTIDEIDEWQSMTSIIALLNNSEGQEKFMKFEQASAKTYLFNFDKSIEITMRVVVGDIEDNIENNGEILVGSEPISKQFTLKIK